MNKGNAKKASPIYNGKEVIKGIPFCIFIL
jgi:hypothetical protein